MRSIIANLALAQMSLLAACAPQPPVTTEKGGAPSVYDLPDWSGAWSADGTGSVGRSVLDAAARPGESVPLTPKHRELRALAVAKYGTQAIYGIGGSGMAKCWPVGMPGLLNHGVAFEFIFSPGRVTMLFEDGEVRRIHTDGRAHPPADELHVDVMGHAVGRWEGAALVVETVGMSSEAELFLANGMKVGTQTRIAERMFKKSPTTLQIDTEITDPEIFTGPYVYSRTYDLTGLGDFEIGCRRHARDNENSIDLTPPPFEDIVP